MFDAHRHPILTVFPLLAFLILLAPTPAAPSWSAWGADVVVEPGDQDQPVIAADGEGGVFVAWRDERGESNDIYVQHLNAAGDRLWEGGIPVCTEIGSQLSPALIPDGLGGVIVAWEDQRNGPTTGDIYVQAVNSEGVPQWGYNGLGVCTQPDLQSDVSLASDGSGGAFIVWVDYRYGLGDPDIMAQWVPGSGTPQWDADGVILAASMYPETDSKVVPDAAGGLVVAWRHNLGTDWDVLAAHFDRSHALLWAATVCGEPGDQTEIDMAGDGEGGVYLVWTDYRTVTPGIYAQHVNPSGGMVWAPGGALACGISGTYGDSHLATGPAGGLYVTWTEDRGAGYGIFAQHMAVSGVGTWGEYGITVCDVTGLQWFAKVVRRADDGIFVTWVDERDSDYHLYAQGVDRAGALLWAQNGFMLGSPTRQQGDFVMAPDPDGGVILVWTERSTTVDLMAQRLEPRYGTWGHPEPTPVSVADNPADQGGKVAVTWAASGRDRLDQRMITHYSVWRATQPVFGEAQAELPFVALSDIGPHFRGPAVILSDGMAWEWTANQDALYEDGYGLLVATRQDSVEGYAADHWFKVVAHTEDPFTFFPSTPMMGRSVDNLAPGAPLVLAATRVGADVVLTWSPDPGTPDLGTYAVYRAGTSGVAPIPAFYISSSADTTFTDTSAPASTLYYIVTGVDIHGNEGEPSNEAMAPVPGGVSLDRPVPAALVLLPSIPNPFRDQTRIVFGVPETRAVRVEVFDVLGRLRWRRDLAAAGPGWVTIPFDGRSDDGTRLPDGLYFTRVISGGESRTGRIVLSR